LWVADSSEALREISDLIHDAWFDSAQAVHDPALHEFVIPFAQEWEWSARLQDDPAWSHAARTQTLKRSWWSAEYRVPFMRGELRVSGVLEVVVDPRFGDADMLLEVTCDENTGQVQIVDCGAGESTATVERLHVEAELRPDLAGLSRRRVNRLSIESSSPPASTQ
jgi:hypothetical protein